MLRHFEVKRGFVFDIVFHRVADIPGIGNSYSSLKSSWDNAVEIQFSAAGVKSKFRVVGILRSCKIQEFNDKCTEPRTGLDWLWYWTTSFGIGMKDISLLINHPVAG